MKCIKQKIFGKNYRLLVAKTKKDKRRGMNIFLSSPKKIGMLFPYDTEEENRSFTLTKTPFPLHVIFLDKNNNIVHQEIGKSFQANPIICKKPSITVIEIPC